MNITTAEELFSSSLNLVELNPAAKQEANTRFSEYQKLGIIKEQCTFDDEVWYTTDEYANIGLYFSFNLFSYQQYEPVFGLRLEDFIAYVKVFLISLLGRNALSSLQSVLLDLRHITNTDIDMIFGATEDIRIARPALCAEFFLMLPKIDENQQINRLVDAMDVYSDINFSSLEAGQRSLEAFDTYFRFDDIIRDFWSSELDPEERAFYYPLYLWWMITGVIPLRPREFLLTQRNCLSTDKEGHYYLKLRRNQLKGRGRSITYKLADDYSVDTYRIPQTLGEDIQKYIDITEGYGKTDIDTLFVTEPHYKKWGQKKHLDSRYLTYTNMNTILKYFFREIVCGKYGLQLKNSYKGRHLADDEIGYIHLGDTRHIALINIMQQGGTPVTAMLLAGHDNIITAGHYYSNIKNLIECKTYRQYRKLISGDIQYQISAKTVLPQADDYLMLSDGGRCYSAAYKDGRIDDCLNVVGENGEIGYCPACVYYRRDGLSFFGSDDIYKRHLQEDCVALKNAIELVRRGKGSIEDLGEVLLKLRASSASYEAYLLEKHKKCKDEV